MTNVDTTAHAKRFTSPTTAPDGAETLAWLAGNQMPDRRRDLQPSTGYADPRTDETLSQTRPSDPIVAAQKRAAILADLNQHAPHDPRVQAVFDADPVVAEDPSNGNLVTQSMLRARADLFDAALTMLGRPILTPNARTRLASTLKTAYPLLDEDSQVEWALSEVRLEEVKLFLGRRAQADLRALGKQLGMIFERSDLWAAARAFSMAAHLGLGEVHGSAVLADLLDVRVFDD